MLARRLDAEALDEVVAAMIGEAKQGKVMAGRLVLDLIRYASDLPDEDVDKKRTDAESDSPALRAARRAELAREAEILARDLREGGGLSPDERSQLEALGVTPATHPAA